MNVIIVTFRFCLFLFALQLNMSKWKEQRKWFSKFSIMKHKSCSTSTSKDQSLRGESSFSEGLITERSLSTLATICFTSLVPNKLKLGIRCYCTSPLKDCLQILCLFYSSRLQIKGPGFFFTYFIVHCQ